MLDLHLYTLIIGYKSCNMLSILNKLILQKELQNFVTNNVFGPKVKTQQQNKNSNIKTLAGAGNLTTATPSQRSVSIVVKLYKCYGAMGRNINKQSWICGPHIFNKFIFSAIFLHAWITIFGSFSYLRE